MNHYPAIFTLKISLVHNHIWLVYGSSILVKQVKNSSLYKKAQTNLEIFQIFFPLLPTLLLLLETLKWSYLSHFKPKFFLTWNNKFWWYSPHLRLIFPRQCILFPSLCLVQEVRPSPALDNHGIVYVPVFCPVLAQSVLVLTITGIKSWFHKWISFEMQSCLNKYQYFVSYFQARWSG